MYLCLFKSIRNLWSSIKLFQLAAAVNIRNDTRRSYMINLNACSNRTDSSSIALHITVVTCKSFESVAYQLPQAASKCYSAHGVKKEVNTKVCVVKEHEELLHAPQWGRRRLSPQREEYKYVETDHITAT